MPNIGGLLNIGRNALVAQQRAIDVTGNNIANVDTPGYSRQRVTLVQNNPIRDAQGVSSTGVIAEQNIQRVYDQFIAAQLSAENETLGRWEAQKSALEKVEVSFDEVSGYGLNDAMSEFWSAWQDLANNPSGSVERSSMLSAGQYLSSVFTQLHDNLVNVQNDLDTTIENKVSEINRMADQIADLNQKIIQVEVSGHSANDYRDERDELLNSLSKLIDIESFEDGNGNLTISVGGGKPLVEGAKSWDLTTKDNGGVQNIFWQDSSGTATDITANINGGELKGYVEARDVVIEGYISSLNELASTIVDEVNMIHNQGIALDGNQYDYFTPGTDASNMSVNSAIVNDVNLIAAAGPTEETPGGSETAEAIAELQSTLTMSAGLSTFDDFYNSLVGDVGNDVQTATINYNHETTMLQYLSNYREEVSGVSLDEEMVNLVKFQHAYNAAAKLITTVDEMLNTLLSMGN